MPVKGDSTLIIVGQDSEVSIATGYGLDVQGISSRGRRDFPHPSDRSWVHPAFYTTDSGSFMGAKRPECGVGHPPPSRAEVKEVVVDLYFCSPYLSSCCIMQWTLPFMLTMPGPSL